MVAFSGLVAISLFEPSSVIFYLHFYYGLTKIHNQDNLFGPPFNACIILHTYIFKLTNMFFLIAISIFLYSHNALFFNSLIL